MATYQVTMEYTYHLTTDDIEKAINLHEFPIFPNLDMDKEVEFEGSKIDWQEVFICNCGEDCGCSTQVNNEGQDCDECYRIHSDPIDEEEE